MSQPNEPWLFIVDFNRGRLLHLSLTEHDRPHIREVARIDNEWEGAEHGRPSPLAAKNARTNATQPDADEDRRRHFAKEVVNWLNTQIARQNIGSLHLYAATRFLGELRKIMPQRMRDVVVEHEGDLTSMPTSELRKHPAVTDLLNVSASR